MQRALDGKVIVVIGGTGGLGFSAVAACAAEGAAVVAVGRDPSKCAAEAEPLADRVVLLADDATQPDTAERAIALAADRFGGFHGLYHVAGGSGRGFGDGPLDALSDDGWRQTLHWNLDSLFYSNRAAVQALLRLGQGGSILNLASMLAVAPVPRHFSTHAYAAAKAAAIGLTRAAAAHYAPQNIRFNALAPGLIATPMSQRAQSDPAILQYLRGKQPLDGGRIGQPADLDAAAVYFLSDASRFVTGQVLCIDGGWSVSEGVVS